MVSGCGAPLLLLALATLVLLAVWPVVEFPVPRPVARWHQQETNVTDLLIQNSKYGLDFHLDLAVGGQEVRRLGRVEERQASQDLGNLCSQPVTLPDIGQFQTTILFPS